MSGLIPVCAWMAAVIAAAEPPAGMELDDGVTVRVYQLEEDLEAIPTLVADQTPNADVLAGRIDLRSGADFGNVGGHR